MHRLFTYNKRFVIFFYISLEMLMLMIGWLKLVSSCKAILLRFDRLPWGRPLCSVFAIIGESKFSSPNEMWRSDDVSKSVRCCDDVSKSVRCCNVVSKSVRCCDVDAVASATFDIVADCDGGRKEAMLTRFEVWLMMFKVDCSIREVVSTVSYFFSFTWKSF